MSQASPQDFSGQNLRGRNFKGQDLIGANFSYANLRGASFKGQNLTGANFSYADIRGTDFNKALLIDANFNKANAGLIYSKVFLVFVVEIALLGLDIVILILDSNIVSSVDNQNPIDNKNFYLLYFFAAVILIVIAILLNSFGFSKSNFEGLIQEKNSGKTKFISYLLCDSIAQFFAYTLFLTGGVALSSSIAHTPLSYVIIFLVSVTTLMIKSSSPLFNQDKIRERNDLMGVRLLFTPLRYVFTSIVAFTGATTFQKANLTDSDFTDSILINTNFEGATTAKVCWLNIKYYGFDLVLLKSENFKEKLIKAELIATRESIDKEFIYLNMESVNLKGKILSCSNFTGINLNHANLKDVDLSGAILKQAQLDGADLTGACLTGAFIEDWGITGDTKLDGIKCEYVYMHVPTKEDPDPIRKPDNRNEIFHDGDFADFIKPLTDTLDLYHNYGVDPRAIATAFKNLAENHPKANLRIVAIEVKGENKFLLRAKTATTADKSELSAEYFSTYNEIKALSEAQVGALLVEKDSRIQSLEAMVVTALQRPSFYSHIERTDSVSNTGGISQNVSGGNVYGGMQAAQGSNNTQSQEIHSIASSEQGLTQSEVIELLVQLELVLRQPELPGEVQAKAAKYLDAAKEEVQAKEPDKQLAAGNLKRMAETIESTSKTMESGKKIWETTKPILGALLPWLGVAKSFFGF